ncbi:MAG TPA: hypothetical protein VM287_15825 [Egibacteraceae bacterium]|nr:hypothetical protein [Egibacteraceae bacterium]
MKRLLAGTFVAALLLLGCGNRSPGGETATGPVPTQPPLGGAVDATITTAAAPVPTTTVTTGEILPAPPTAAAPPTTTRIGASTGGWAVCTNAQRGYSVGHPVGWHSAYGCRYLDPEPLDIPPNTDGFFSAVAVVDGDTSFDQARQRSTDRFVVIVLREETTIGGRRAVRYETEATGEGLFDKGSRVYSVVLDNRGRAFEVVTAWFPGTSTSEYQARKKMVDEVVNTVRFLQ